MATKVIDIRFTRIRRHQEDRLIDQYRPWFPESHLHAVRRYRKWQDRTTRLAGRLLLLAALNDLSGPYRTPIPLDYEPAGRPFLVSSPLDFNISHANDFVVCALADSPRIGIDLEYIKDINFLDFKESLAVEEWRHLSESPDPTRTFYQYWTMKECVLKADGRGLALPVPLNEMVRHDGRMICDGREWFIEEIELDRHYACHLAVDTGNYEVVLNEMDLLAP